jgi:NAD(P)-dependent dehydrogenase (short-subunit alcohol dehydrogenase family)
VRLRGSDGLLSYFKLTGKTCLVTGGSRGIGFGMARALALAGADLMLWSNQPSSLASAAEELARTGQRVLTRLVDVSDESQILSGMDHFRSSFGRLDGVIGAAGIAPADNPFRSSETIARREVFAVNLDGTYWTFRECCRLFEEQARAGAGGGSIIGIGSLAGRFAAPMIESYAASKLAIEGVIRSIAVEMAKFGIRANAVIPGWIATDMSQRYRQKEAVNDKIIQRIPARRWGTPDDLGGIAVYLMSDASAYHSGDCLVIDGGYSVC